MSAQNENKKKKWLLPVIIGAAVVALGVAAAIVIPKVVNRPAETVSPSKTEEIPTDEPYSGVYEGDLYWNVDRLTYAGKSEIGMSSRTADKLDGYYHITFAVNGRQVERRVADKKVVNMIDTQDVMGLLFDESGIVTGVVPITSIIDGFSVNGLYVKEVLEDGEFELNTSESLLGRTPIFENLKGYKVYDVSGLSTNFVGMEIGVAGIQVHDRLFGIEMPNGSKIIYVTDRFVEIPIYWNVERKYDTAIASTTRKPDENGDYTFLFAFNGEQVTLKTKSLSIASQIDRNAAKVVSLSLAENGYISKVTGASTALRGSTWGSWAHVTYLFGNQIKAEKYSGSDEGKLWEGVLADDVRVFDCSSTAEFVGIAVDDLKPTDQVHCLMDSSGEIKYVFIVGRMHDSPIYWNQKRMYDSKTKETTRTPDANGWYVFDMCVNGGPVTLRTKDKAVATAVDAYAARCMGLVLDGDVILKTIGASSLTCTGRGTAASWHHVMTVTDATHFHAKKTVKTASDYLHEIDVEIAEDCQIYNVSTNFTSVIGERTTVRVGDQIHCLTNLKNQASVIFVITRPVSGPVYWNVTRKYNSTTKETTRTPEEDGYYHIIMAAEGRQIELRTKDKSIATQVDNKPARCMGLTLSGDIIVKVHAASAVVGATGGTAGSWSDVTRITGSNKFHVKKNTVGASNYGEEEDIVMAPGCKVFNVGGLYTFSGEASTVQVGDTVHCLLNLEGQATTVYIVSRSAPKAPDRTAYCPDCGKNVKWTGFTNSLAGKEGEVTHYYIAEDIPFSKQPTMAQNVTVHFDLNGCNLKCPPEDRGISPWSEGSKLVIMNLKQGKEASIIGGLGTSLGNYGALTWVRYNSCELTIRDVTIDASAVDQTVTRAVIYVGAGTLNLKNVKIIGAKHVQFGGALYVAGTANLENVTIEGGTSEKFGSVYVTAAGKLNLKGDVRISGGKLDNGENANVYLAGGALLGLPAGGLTSPDGAIGIRLEKEGVFTENGMAASLAKFTSDVSTGSVTANEDNALQWTFEITGIEVKESEITVEAGKPVVPEIVWLPAAKSGVTLSYASANPAIVQVTETGELIAVRDSAGQKVRITVTASTGHTAAFDVIVTPPDADAHYHVEGTHADIVAGNGTKISYEPWEKTDMIPTKSGYYYLTADIVITNNKQPGIPAGQNVHICLNGHKITNETPDNVLVMNLFSTDGETLSITDCSEGETGSVVATGSYAIQGRAIWIRANNTLNIYGGTYVGAESTKAGGGTLGCEPGSTINFYGGTVKGGTSTIAGGNVYVNGTFNFYGGTIEGGSAPKGGNIIVEGKGTFNQYGGVITGGKATAGAGGNLYFGGKTMTLQSGVIENGSTSDSGGNLCIATSGTVSLDNMTLRGGVSANPNKSEIHVNASQLQMTVKDTTVEGGMYVMGAGKITLTGNTKLGTETKNGIYIVNGGSYTQKIAAESLGTGAKIYISADRAGILVENGAAFIDKFVLTKTGELELKANGAHIELAERNQHVHDVSGGKIANGHTFGDGTVHTATDAVWQPWTKTDGLPVWNNLVDGDNYFYLTGDVTMTTNYRPGGGEAEDMSSRRIYICLNGFTVTNSSQVFLSTLKATSPSVTHSSNLRITFTDCHGTPGTIRMTRTESATLPAFAWLGGTGAVVNLYNVTVDGSGFNSTGTGSLLRAIYGTVSAYNVTFKCGTTTNKGGIYVGGETASFKMYGGTVNGGTATDGGSIFSYGTVELYGATVTGGTATSGVGGNIALYSDVDSVIKDSTVSGGTSKGSGGNLYVGSKGLTVTNSSFTGGTSQDAGGNVCISGSSATAQTVLFDGVTVTGGTASTATRANVLINRANSSVNWKDTTIGDGIYLLALTNLTLSGSTKVGTSGGAGLYINNANYTQEIAASSLGADAMIYLQAATDGIIVKNGASAIAKFANSGDTQNSIRANGADLEYVSGVRHCVCCGSLVNGATLPDGTVHTCVEVKWLPWTSSTSLPIYGDLAAGENYYYLTGDVTLEKEWRIGRSASDSDVFVDDMGGRNLTLCINGHTITEKATVFMSALKSTSGGVTFTNNIHITLTDFPNNPGTVKATTTTGDLPAFGWFASTGIEFTTYSVIYDATAHVVGSANKSGKAGSTFRLNNDAKMTMYSGKILGGKITGSKDGQTAAYTLGFGGVCVSKGTTFTMYGGEISGGSSESNDPLAKVYGGNLYVNGTANLYNGVIKDGVAVSNGGNIFVDGSGVLTMKGMQISGGVATNDAGGSIFLSDKSTAIIENSVVSGGQAMFFDGTTRKGGGNIFSRSADLTIRNTSLLNGSCTDAGGNLMFSAGTSFPTYNVVLDNVTMSGGTAQYASKANSFVNNARLNITIKDCNIDTGFEVRNAKAIKLVGKVIAGSETAAGFFVQGSDTQYPLDASELAADALIYLTTTRKGILVQNAKERFDCFKFIAGSVTGSMEIEGENLVLK